MKMKRLVQIGDRTGTLEWRNHGDQVEGAVAWKDAAPSPHHFHYAEVEPGVYSVLTGKRAMEARVLPGPNQSLIVELLGRSYAVRVRDPREIVAQRDRSGAEGRRDISAPMPGKVVRVLVEVGVMVETGQGLVVVEAMKMQNELKAPKAGKVVALAAKAGASVTAGQVLVTLE